MLAQSLSTPERIEKIEIFGNKRISTATVLSYTSLSIGDLASKTSLNNAVESLYGTDLFKDIRIEVDGGLVQIYLLENPIINRVNIEGNDVISDEKLLEFLDIQPRRVYTKELALGGVERLVKIYEASGRHAAIINPEVIELDENRVDLIFSVDEGPLVKIKSISFFGNSAFTDRKLRSVIASRENRWWAFFAATDKYDKGRLDYDIRLLRQFYLQRGYADIEVTRAVGGLLPNRSGFAVSFLLNEGLRYKVDAVKIQSKIPNIDIDKMRSLVSFESGEWFDLRTLEQGLLEIGEELGNYGYAFVDVIPDVKTNQDTGTLEVAIMIGEAKKNFVERIEIINNSRTLDTVIRREMELVEGDAFSNLKLDRSLRNVRNLGYFSDVKVRNYVGSSDGQTVTEFDVEEQSTGELSVGIGYSSLTQMNAKLGINERNFRGTGRALEALIGFSDESTDISVGLTEPYFLGRDLSASASVFNEKQSGNGAKQDRMGFDFGIGFTAAKDIYHRLGYVLAEGKTVESSNTATSITGENGSKLLQSSLSYTIGRDTRDNRRDPNDGKLVELFQEVAGLGGDVTFSKTKVQSAFYKPMLFDSVVFGLKGQFGYVTGLGEKVTRSQRFFIGGHDVRGFDAGGIGPRDTGSNNAVGGNYLLNGSIEVVSTAGINKDLGVRWTVFSDFGSVWETDYPSGVTGADEKLLRTSIGFGILWDTAIGPLSFYWANAISKESYDKLQDFQFTIGTRL